MKSQMEVGSRKTRGREGIARILAAGVALLASAGVELAEAQSYPSRPLRVVVGFPPGGGADINARLLAPKLREALGQPVIVDNRPGGGSNIANEIVARAAPDGYTMLVSPATVTINMSLYRKLGYDTLRDLAGVSIICSTPLVMVVGPALPVKSVKEFLAVANAKPGEINFSSAGSGTVSHLTGELFRTVTKTRITHIPFKGSGPSLTSLMGGEVQASFPNIAAVIQHVRSGRLRALATTGPERADSLPEVPTMKESGVDVKMDIWYGVLVPAATPRDVIEKLADTVAKAVHAPDVKPRFLDQGAAPVGNRPEEFAKQLREEVALWAEIVRMSGAKPD
jgi:tripartite-type tricarboxylate transporter receptor subunit TctC